VEISYCRKKKSGLKLTAYWISFESATWVQEELIIFLQRYAIFSKTYDEPQICRPRRVTWRKTTNIRPHGREFSRLGYLAPRILFCSFPVLLPSELWRRVVWYVPSFRMNLPLPHSTLVTSWKTIKLPISRRFGPRFSQNQRNFSDLWIFATRQLTVRDACYDTIQSSNMSDTWLSTRHCTRLTSLVFPKAQL
jgi:hypothetical protein